MNREFQRVNSELEILTNNFNLTGMHIIDVGCGTGKVAGLLASCGAVVFGIDIPELIKIAVASVRTENIHFSIGTAQAIPFINGFADAVLYFASFHHIPETEMNTAVSEAVRVLKSGGSAIFIEPVAYPGSYYDITRLVEDEKDIQAKACQVICAGETSGLAEVTEDFYFLERSFKDYINLLNIYVPDEQRRINLLSSARELICSRGENPDSVIFRSFCRLNVLKKVNL